MGRAHEIVGGHSKYCKELAFRDRNMPLCTVVKLRVRLSAEREASRRRGVSRQDFRVAPTPVSARERPELGSPPGHLSPTRSVSASSDLCRTQHLPIYLNISLPAPDNEKGSVRVGCGPPPHSGRRGPAWRNEFRLLTEGLDACDCRSNFCLTSNISARSDRLTSKTVHLKKKWMILRQF